MSFRLLGLLSDKLFLFCEFLEIEPSDKLIKIIKSINENFEYPSS